MSKLKSGKSDLYKLSKHSIFQIGFFLILFGSVAFASYFVILKAANAVIQYTDGIVYNGRNQIFNSKTEKFESEQMGYRKSIDSKQSEKLIVPNFYFKWAIDIGENDDNRTRYWINPTISVLFPSLLTGLMLSLWLSAFLPGNFGFIRQKIEREIFIQLDKLYYKRYGVNINDNHHEVAEEIMEADIRRMRELSKEYEMLFDELNVIRKALLWHNSSMIGSIVSSINALIFYMKFYFTEKYSNTVMGMVYIGAAVLIIIIGMRGLKFIPSTEPTFVLFALGLEFSLLLTYAFTLMLSKQENTQDYDSSNSNNNNILSAHDLDNAVEIENLLRMFIKDVQKKPENK